MRTGIVILAATALLAQAPADVEKGTFTLHLLMHAIGQESYEIARSADGRLTLTDSFEYSDRGMKRPLNTVLHLRPDLTPESFELKGRTTQAWQAASTLPPKFFVGI